MPVITMKRHLLLIILCQAFLLASCRSKTGPASRLAAEVGPIGEIGMVTSYDGVAVTFTVTGMAPGDVLNAPMNVQIGRADCEYYESLGEWGCDPIPSQVLMAQFIFKRGENAIACAVPELRLNGQAQLNQPQSTPAICQIAAGSDPFPPPLDDPNPQQPPGGGAQPPMGPTGGGLPPPPTETPPGGESPPPDPA